MIRPSRHHAFFEGRWFVCDDYPLPNRPQTAILLDHVHRESDWYPAPGFTEGASSTDIYIRTIDESLVEARMKVTTTCSFRGGGPFTVVSLSGVDPVLAFLSYTGADWDWAERLPTFERFTNYDFFGSGVFGTAAVAELTDIREETEPIPTHYDAQR
ncbi:hypothetical protein AX769_01035 [Frondihabitans sp. PAMC 28766]|uniref:hypothetical protein n=1 Tax=Frondihabitans sp. PAMC 28766 TaxID=1795630 RepID=UPI00078D1B54|nr:hypothetical protein [Frondihabitans sp. PAMC 28766]AMM18980.1 hypothetical protein AX769_01035 [Frondihabitans sp. PAMC 28766]